MKELIIFEFQAKHIEDTLRLIIRTLLCNHKQSSMDRDVMQAMDMITNVINELPKTHSKR